MRRLTADGSRLTAWLIAVSCVPIATGCIRRQLTVRSEPAGAELRMNDHKIGVTPVSYDFQWYGSYRLSLTKDGYHQLDDKVLLKSPWYLWIPLDLVMELLPFEIRDTRELSYRLHDKPALEVPVPPQTTEE